MKHKITIKLRYINMLFPAKLHKSQVPLLLLIFGVLVLSIASITDAAKNKHSKQKSFSSGGRGRSNRVDASFEMEESTAASLYPSTTKKYTVVKSAGKGKATFRGSRNQFFSKSKLTGAHGQVGAELKLKYA